MFYFFFFVLLLHRVPKFARGESWLNFTIIQVVQCEPFTVNFSSQTMEMDIPMTLTVLPFSSSPIVIPIPSIALNSTGFLIASLPLRAGEDFIASLDDAEGKPIAQVSDVTRVLPSPTGNNTCLETSALSFHTKDNFKLISTPTQCEDLAVAYNTEVVESAPTVRAFTPNGDSSLLPQASDDLNGTATYVVNVQRGLQVLFLFDDGSRHRETTDLITVAGDSTSSKDCLTKAPTTGNDITPTDLPGDDQTPNPIPQEVIIGCSVGGAVILLIAISMVVFVIRDRKRRRRRTILSFVSQRSFGNAPPLPPKGETTGRNPFEEVPFAESATGNNLDGSYRTNPPYVMGELDGKDDGKPPLARRSFSSWSHDDGSNARDVSLHRRPSVDPVQVLDIEGMLNMATALSGSQIIKQAMESQPQSLRSRESQSTVASLGASGHVGPSRVRHWRAPSDVPADLTGSGTFSGYSLIMPNPFNNTQDIELPSPFIREDEPARPASDIVRPSSIERKEESASRNPTNDPEPEKREEGKRTVRIESREDT